MLIMSLVSGCFDGNKNGNLVNSLNGALWILPPQRIYPSASRNRRSCLTSDERLVDLSFSFYTLDETGLLIIINPHT